MDTKIPELTRDQWNFLGMLYAVGEPIALDIAEKLSPIQLGSFLDLLGRNHIPALIRETENGQVCLSPELSDEFTRQLETFIDSGGLSDTMDRLDGLKPFEQIPVDMVSKLFIHAGRYRELAELEIDLARKALNCGDPERTMHHLSNAVETLYGLSDGPGVDQLFVATTLNLCDLCAPLGTGSSDLVRFLKKALVAAERLGDRRSYALINLNLHGLYRIVGKQHEASLKALKVALTEIEDLGDADILSRSAILLGLNFYAQGLFSEAAPHLERASRAHQLQGGEDLTIGTLHIPMLVSSCLAHQGHFHDAVGKLEFFRRILKRRSQDTLATTYQAHLGTLLQMMNRGKDASRQFEISEIKARETDNPYALAIVGISLSYQHYLDGHVEESNRVFDRVKGIENAKEFEAIYNIPYIQQMVLELEQARSSSSTGSAMAEDASWIMKGANIYLKGIVFRLLALEGKRKGENLDRVRAYLAESEKYLQQSGDPVQLARTWMETARLELDMGNLFKARMLARKAREKLPDFTESLFPGDLLPLLKKENRAGRRDQPYKDFFNRFMMIFENLSFEEDLDEILLRTLKQTCRLFAAERGVLFRIKKAQKNIKPEMWAGHNISGSDLIEQDFDGSMKMIRKVMKIAKPAHQRFTDKSRHRQEPLIRQALCLPLAADDGLFGLLYLDNVYLDNHFHLLDKSMQQRMANFMSMYIARVVAYSRLREERMILSSVKSTQLAQLNKEEIVFESRVMRELLGQVDRVAPTESTVLIQGETGVGKELFAGRLHSLSNRRSGPLEIIELTSIPENLLESELVGYEKGAFTGADRQKRGRVELAHKGTLFLDEIGDIPPSFQAKLLRVLQEKSFKRLGGTKTLSSDFRLIAATNKDLQKEVDAGRFRQDLFYRLNVITLTIPPLREREDDGVVMAHHFLELYTQKHNKGKIFLRPEDIALLRAYPWPGNVRELKNVIERAVLLSRNNRLDFSALQITPLREISTVNNFPLDSSFHAHLFDELPTLEDFERQYILHVIEKTGGKLSGPGGASEILGMKRETLYSRMKRLGLR